MGKGDTLKTHVSFRAGNLLEQLQARGESEGAATKEIIASYVTAVNQALGTIHFPLSDIVEVYRTVTEATTPIPPENLWLHIQTRFGGLGAARKVMRLPYFSNIALIDAMKRVKRSGGPTLGMFVQAGLMPTDIDAYYNKETGEQKGG